MVVHSRKGFIRTIEAIIAIVIILIVSYTVVVREPEQVSEVPSVVAASQDLIVQHINLNESVRSCILEDRCNGHDGLVSEVIEQYQPPGYEYAFRICESPSCVCDDSEPAPCQVFGCFENATGGRECAVDQHGYPSFGEVFMDDTFVSASSVSGEHRIVRFWMWRAS